MREDISTPKEGIYNSAAYQMFQIHTIQSRIDENFISPLKHDPEANCFNYQKILADLLNLLNKVEPKLTPKESEIAEFARKEVKAYEKEHPVYQEINKDGKAIQMFKQAHWDKLYDLIVDYRALISELMDKHGLGNPDKQNAGVSIIS